MGTQRIDLIHNLYVSHNLVMILETLNNKYTLIKYLEIIYKLLIYS